MTYIPDCRKDENYNENYLNDDCTKFLAGYDYAVDQIANIFNNLEVYPDLEELLEDNKAIIKENKADIAQESMSEWMEGHRDELIVSMIDGMDEEEYEAIKEKVDGQSEERN